MVHHPSFVAALCNVQIAAVNGHGTPHCKSSNQGILLLGAHAQMAVLMEIMAGAFVPLCRFDGDKYLGFLQGESNVVDCVIIRALSSLVHHSELRCE